MLGILVVNVPLFLCLADRMFCNLLVVYGQYVLISVCMVILRITVLYYTGIRHHLLLNY